MEKYVSGREFTVLVYKDIALIGERIFKNPDEINFYTESGEFSTLRKVSEREL